MKWISKLFGKKKKTLSPQDEIPQQVIETSESHDSEYDVYITLGNESLTFFATLRRLFHPTQKGRAKKHSDEFKRLEKEYQDHIQENSSAIVNDTFPSLTIGISQSFYETWIPQVFDEVFSIYNRTPKPEAEALNDLHRSLKGKDHPTYRENYKRYPDR